MQGVRRSCQYRPPIQLVLNSATLVSGILTQDPNGPSESPHQSPSPIHQIKDTRKRRRRAQAVAATSQTYGITYHSHSSSTQDPRTKLSSKQILPSSRSKDRYKLPSEIIGARLHESMAAQKHKDNETERLDAARRSSIFDSKTASQNGLDFNVAMRELVIRHPGKYPIYEKEYGVHREKHDGELPAAPSSHAPEQCRRTNGK